MRPTPDELVRITRLMSEVPSRKTKRALTTSATQRPQRPLLAKTLEHYPEKCAAVFREDHAQTTTLGLLVRRLVAVGVALGAAGENLLGDQAGVLADRGLDLDGDVGIGLQERFRVLAALAEALAVIGEPGAGLFA